jgi:DNA ligase-1
MTITKPMLAATLTNENNIKFPVFATPKIDGIRCLRIGGKSLSRSFKEIPNRHIQQKMAELPDGLDGELVGASNWGKYDNFQNTVSKVMSKEGIPDFKYVIFDYVPVTTTLEYRDRIQCLKNLWLPLEFCVILTVKSIDNLNELYTYEQEQLNQNYEGICIRQPDSPYKCGRSTEKEGYLIKIKRFKDSEAEIIGFEEQMENTNEPKKDEFGYIKRSTSKLGKVGKNTLGKFVVYNKIGVFKIGTGIGLTDKLRKEIWNNQDTYLGKLITFKYQEMGTKNLPRSPIFKGFRDKEDL